jgi:hypothetical protein
VAGTLVLVLVLVLVLGRFRIRKQPPTPTRVPLRPLLRSRSMDLFPSFAELAASNRAAGARLSRPEALAFLESVGPLRDPAARSQRDELLALARDAPLDEVGRRRCGELLAEAIRVSGFPVRPGTFEDLACAEGALDRLERP